MIVISQSGETADTLAALRKAPERTTLRSPSPTWRRPPWRVRRRSHILLRLDGNALCLPTKSFTGQLLNLYLLTLLAAETKAFDRGGLSRCWKN